LPDTRSKRRARSANRLAALIAGVVVVLGGAGTARIGNADGGDTATPASAGSAAAAPSTARTGTGNLSVNQTYRRDWAGVVDIRVTTTTTSPGPLGLPTTQEAQAEGAGVVFDKNGDILTDEHVVSGTRTATVTFGDGVTAKAKVIGTDPSTDVAVIRVSAAASELHPIAFADSESARVGDPVVAIGSPFGLPQTVTSGIVSAVGRSIPAPNEFTIVGAIQTDAPINPGNSGGPLLDGRGDVLGLADQIETGGTAPGAEGQSAGIGFATPSNTVANVAQRIIAGRPVAHAYLGVSLNSASAGGAEVASVQSSSPAAKVGLKPRDIITAVNGKPVKSAQQFIETLDFYSPGQTVTLTVRRGGGTGAIKVKLGTRPRTVSGG
jgi:putative serine protease PepD